MCIDELGMNLNKEDWIRSDRIEREIQTNFFVFKMSVGLYVFRDTTTHQIIPEN